MKKTAFLSISLLTLFFVSCSNNPTSRIKHNPAIYSELSPSHQALVSEGKIEQGMSKPAVFLAMGRADSEQLSMQDGKSIERWNYNTLHPVYSYGGYGGYSNYGYGGYGYGGYGHGRSYGRRGGYRSRGGGRYSYGYTPSVAYIPAVGSSVYFGNEKVTGWQGIRK